MRPPQLFGFFLYVTLLLFPPLLFSHSSQTPPLEMVFEKKVLSILTGQNPAPLDAQKINPTKIFITDRKSIQNRERTRAYLAQEYKKLGLSVQIQNYGSGKDRGANLIATKPPSLRAPNKEISKNIVIIGAHFDSSGFAGANDNASGVVSTLAVARHVGQLTTPHFAEYRFVSFDQEERGLFGSKYYVESLRKANELQNVLAVLIFEMTGFDPEHSGKYLAIDCRRAPFIQEPQSPKLAQAFVNAVSKSEAVLKRVVFCGAMSDHHYFWKAKVPAIVVSGNTFVGVSDPCMHKKCDTFDKINFNFLSQINRSAALFAETLGREAF